MNIELKKFFNNENRETFPVFTEEELINIYIKKYIEREGE